MGLSVRQYKFITTICAERAPPAVCHKTTDIYYTFEQLPTTAVHTWLICSQTTICNMICAHLYYLGLPEYKKLMNIMPAAVLVCFLGHVPYFHSLLGAGWKSMIQFSKWSRGNFERCIRTLRIYSVSMLLSAKVRISSKGLICDALFVARTPMKWDNPRIWWSKAYHFHRCLIFNNAFIRIRVLYHINPVNCIISGRTNYNHAWWNDS